VLEPKPLGCLPNRGQSDAARVCLVVNQPEAMGVRGARVVSSRQHCGSSRGPPWSGRAMGRDQPPTMRRDVAFNENNNMHHWLPLLSINPPAAGARQEGWDAPHTDW